MSIPEINPLTQRAPWEPGRYVGDGVAPRTFTAGNLHNAVLYREQDTAHSAMDAATCAIRKMLRACGANDNPRKTRKLA